MGTTITIDELFSELQKYDGSNGEGETAREMGDRLGLPEKRIAKYLRSLVAGGRVIVTRKTVLSITGARVPVPAYIVVEGKRKKK